MCALMMGVILHTSHGASLDRAVISQVVNDVKVVDKDTLDKTEATEGQQFSTPDLLETGRRSRAQLKAPDGTITRVGSNTLFSFKPGTREINLERGNVLFNSPTGRGGGTVTTAAASAAVVGTTIVVSATPNGGFKMVCFEGTAQVQYPGGASQTIGAGQMGFVLPGSQPGPVVDVNLGTMVRNSSLINGFGEPLPSQEKIDEEVEEQEKAIADGEFAETQIAVLDALSGEELVTLDLSTTTEVNPAVTNNGPYGSARQVDISIQTTADSLNTMTGGVTFALSEIFGSENAPAGTESSDDILRYNYAEPYQGYIARNITLAGHQGTSSSYRFINFETFTGTGSEKILIIAEETVSIASETGNLQFTGLSGKNAVFLVAKSLALSSGTANDTSLSIDTAYSGVILGLAIFNGFDASNFNLSNSGGNLDIYAGGNITWNSGSIYASTAAGATTEVETPGTFTGTSINVTGNTVTFHANITNISNSTINASNTLNMGNISGSTADLISLNNVTINNASTANITARTVNLQNVTFPSAATVNLRSSMGQANFPADASGAQTGYVNFIGTGNYHGAVQLVQGNYNAANRQFGAFVFVRDLNGN